MDNGKSEIKKREEELNIAIQNATSIITKNYLEKLELFDLTNPSEEDIDIDVVECGKFYKLTKLIINKEENFLDKLTTVVNVARTIDTTLTTIIDSDGVKVDYYLGIISKNYRLDNIRNQKRREADAKAFEGTFSGNFQGSEYDVLSEEDIEILHNKLFSNKNSSIASISGIVGLRNKDDKNIKSYVQGIENLVDALKGIKYTIIMIADPVSTAQIEIIKEGYETLHTELSSYLRMTYTVNQSDTVSTSLARTKGFTEGITKGISLTQSKSTSSSKSLGKNSSLGANLGASFGLSAGISANKGWSKGEQYGEGNVVSESSNKQENLSQNESDTKTDSDSFTKGNSVQFNYENKSIKVLLDKIDKYLERLDQCESFGAFDCASYVIVDNREDALTVSSNYNALMRGTESSIQSSHINTWHDLKDTRILNKYLSSFVHPRFIFDESNIMDDNIILTPASIVSGNEIAIQVGLPKKSINGISVIEMAPFGRNVNSVAEDNMIELGNLYHMGKDEALGQLSNIQKVKLDIESLSSHVFITGSTGKGKSTAIYSILDKLMSHKVKGKNDKIKFMVIEPAKGEYKNRFGCYDNVSVYGTNYKKMPLLRINPFSFPDDIHVLEHIDRLIEIFNVCWPMYAAMPAVLKDAVEKSYIACGWNLETSECRYTDSNGNSLYPSFVDVLRQINRVMDDSSYSSDSKGDYKGALCTRLKSLTNGLYRQIFSNDELSGKQLFDENVIIDLSRTGSSETKSLIMGLLIMKLQEYRMSNVVDGNEPLKHITVLEEAHNILKRTSTEQSNEGANMLGKSVEMLSNSIAEMRTYGESFIIADQAPGLMDLSAIRNTNTKIILGLPDLEDRKLVGRAASLNEDQILELSRLKTFVAAVYQNNWLEPVLCNIDTNFKTNTKYTYKHIKNEEDLMKYIDYLLLPSHKKNIVDSKYLDELINDIYKLQIPSEDKVAFIKYTKSKTKDEIQKLRGQIAYSLFNSQIAFSMAKGKEDNISVWYEFIIETLEPNIIHLNEIEQQKIVALLVKEQARIDGTKETSDLFERFMNHI